MPNEICYEIVWEDAHGVSQVNLRHGKAAQAFINEIFNLGCKLVSVEIYARNGM